MDSTLFQIFIVACTILIFYFVKGLQSKFNILVLNPVLLTVVSIIAVLLIFDIPYNKYEIGGKYIEFWLKPAIVSLGVPLYLVLKSIKKYFLPIIVSQIVGCVIGIISVVLIAQLFDVSKEIIISLSPKSVTTPIAIEISEIVGGIPSLTAAVVVCVGIFGAVFGRYILKIGNIKSPIAMGLSIGTATHAVGTSAAMQWSEKCGAYSGLGLILNGIFTALLTPYILEQFNYI